VLALVVLLAAAAFAFSMPNGIRSIHSTVQNRLAFDRFVQQYNKSYSDATERIRRFKIFCDNKQYIETFNAAGQATYTLAVNEYADMTNAEFVSKMTGLLKNAAVEKHIESPDALPAHPEVTCPANGAQYTCDWRQAGVVTPIKNQGQCGSCWAFSAVASTEGAHALATGKLVSLSEQNLVDCSTAEGNQGCSGGLMDQAFTYIMKNKGIDTEASYPYQGVQGKCAYKAANSGATITNYKNLPTGNENTLQQACQSVGPISVAIDASHASFQFYSSGVYYDAACSSTQLDHGVTVVGYGVLTGSNFWLVKNSWGTSWGLAGYILMSRDKNNNCGIATMPSYPLA